MEKTNGAKRLSKEDSLDHISRLSRIGQALSAERNLEKLFEMIVDEARAFTHADGGTLYLMSDDEKYLHFVIVHNESLKIRMGGTGTKIFWPPVALLHSDGTPNFSNVSAYAAISGKVVNIQDVYDAAGFNFEGTKKFDAETGYRSRSMLIVPMRDHEGDIVGVLQLLNARHSESKHVMDFSPESQAITASLASQAAVALSNHRLINALENLLESFITAIASTIDEKSPYTGGHVRRVAELTMAIAGKINESQDGPFEDIHFTNDQLRELRMAAWLHDVGKITTPEHIVDKATKLQTIYDRIEVLKARFEIMRMELERQAAPDTEKPAVPECGNRESVVEDIHFLSQINLGDEYLSDEKIERIRRIAAQSWVIGNETRPLIDPDELKNLTIRRGTLNDEERQIINNHALVTYKLLSSLPFPKKLKNVPLYAAAHHERPNGTGYPWGLKDDQFPLQSRIIALADVFEALTAGDRPYKKGKSFDEAMKILQFMVKDGHIDPDLFNLFVKYHINLEYAEKPKFDSILKSS